MKVLIIRLNMLTDFYDKFQELRNTGNPFVIATVVRAEKPTSAKVGAKAIITEDSKLDGWVGGSCAEPTVKREAKKALQDGQPRLIRLCPPEKLGQAPQEGVIEIPLTCISGGTLEIYIEPQLAQPHLVVIGHLATAEALVRLGKGLGWRVSLMGLDVTRISQEPNIFNPRISKFFEGPPPTISVNDEIPMPMNSPRARFSACSLRRSS